MQYQKLKYLNFFQSNNARYKIRNKLEVQSPCCHLHTFQKYFWFCPADRWCKSRTIEALEAHRWLLPSMLTHFLQSPPSTSCLLKKLFIHSSSFPFIPYATNLIINFLWDTFQKRSQSLYTAHPLALLAPNHSDTLCWHSNK